MIKNSRVMHLLVCGAY